jgi:hypothetical protein
MLGKRATLYLIALTLAATGIVAACANNPTPRIVATTASYGKVLMQGIDTAQQAVIRAEAAGVIQRNAARASVQRFVDAAAAGEKASAAMDRLLNISDATSRASLIAEIVALLDSISGYALNALVPVENQQLRAELSALVAEISRTIATINREVLR